MKTVSTTVLFDVCEDIADREGKRILQGKAGECALQV